MYTNSCRKKLGGELAIMDETGLPAVLEKRYGGDDVVDIDVEDSNLPRPITFTPSTSSPIMLTTATSTIADKNKEKMATCEDTKLPSADHKIDTLSWLEALKQKELDYERNLLRTKMELIGAII
jgi:hypothetical protein